jgi:hypothetical protein
MKRGLIGTAGVMALLALPGLAHAAWSKTYVVSWSEPAFYYGAKEGTVEPGTDCPKGVNHEPNWTKVMMDAGYTEAQAKWLRNPANPTRSAIHDQNQMAFRGKDWANVYIHPTSTPESGEFLPVTGTIGEGINLDGDAKTGFTSPSGEPGIDNNLYKALGCWKMYRGPAKLSYGALANNNYMKEGSWTIVMVVSGKGSDPMNDKDVQVGFYESPDKLVKDGNGDVARDYSFSIRPSAKFEGLFTAKTVKGQIVSTKAENEIWLRDPSYERQVQLLKAQIKLQMEPDGTLTGFVGGYRPWEDLYKAWVHARGPVMESVYWMRLPDIYYALKRYADYSPPGAKGVKTHISYDLRIEAVPAFVMTPDGKDPVTQAVSYKAQAKGPDPIVPHLIFNVVDGIVVEPGQAAVSQSIAQITPPPEFANPPVAALSGTRTGG